MNNTHLKLAFRQLRKQRFFTLLNVLGLTLGLAAALSLFLYVQKEYAYDQYHRNANNICRVNLEVAFDDIGEIWGNAPNITGPALTEAIPEIKQYLRLLHHNFGETASVAVGTDHFVEDLMFWADSTIFEVWDVPLIEGNEDYVLDEPNRAIISERTAMRLFGQQNPVGQSIRVDDYTDLEITGVFADFPSESSWQANVIGSFSSLKWAASRLYWSNASFETFLLMRPGYDQATVEQKMKAVLDNAIEPENQWFSLFLQPLTDIHLHSTHVTSSYVSTLGDASQVRLMGMLALAVLLLACFNYINLTTARSQRRTQEVGISKSLGASSWHMVGRFMTETGLLVLIAISLALFLVKWSEPQLQALTGRELQLTQLLQDGWWISIPAIALIVTIIAGIYPALALGLLSPKQLLYASQARGSRQAALRKMLVVGQFVVCIALVAGALLCREQIQFITQKNLGYRSAATVAVQLGGSRNEPGKASFAAAAERLSGVDQVARVQAYPGISTSGYSVTDPYNEELTHGVLANRSEPGVEELLDLELLAGRPLPVKLEGDTTIDVIINEKLATILGHTPEEAIGQVPGDLFHEGTKVVGVVKDFHFESLHHPIGAYALHNGLGRGRSNVLLVRLATTEVQSVLPQLEQAFRSHLPDAAFDYSFLEQQLATLYESEQRLSSVVWVFTILTIIISGLGLLGLATFAAAQRTKEISIRKVLGASVSSIIMLLSRDFLLLVTLAIILAIPLAWWGTQEWLNGFAYRIDLHWSVFALAGGLGLLVAFITIAGQSWRAALVNPAENLRGE